MTPGLLLFALLQAAAPPAETPLVLRAKPLPVPEAILDMAFLDDRRVLALAQGTLYLYRLDDDGPILESRLVLPGEFLTVRASAGVLRVAEAEGACWALTNRRERASLVALEGRRLVLRLEAEAIPWPGSSSGLRYRTGTNELLLDDTSYFALRDDGLGVDDRGGLVVPEHPELRGRRSGTALARLGDAIVASSPRAPDFADSIVILGSGGSVSETSVAGRIGALAARRRRGDRVVVAAVEGVDATDDIELLVYRASATP